MVMAGHQVPTPTVTQQRTEIHLQIPPPQMKRYGILLYQIDSSSIQVLLSQATSTSGGGYTGKRTLK